MLRGIGDGKSGMELLVRPAQAFCSDVMKRHEHCVWCAEERQWRHGVAHVQIAGDDDLRHEVVVLVTGA
jgi:hypothetical protein